jgi:hypothetical protein
VPSRCAAARISQPGGSIKSYTDWLPIPQRRGAGLFRRAARWYGLFHGRRGERGRRGELSLAGDGGETAQRIPQTPLLAVFGLAIWVVAHWGDLERFREEAIADGTYSGEPVHPLGNFAAS